ncbi:uncharacterized protein PITG_14477 [Phytophthora infestans T30-4]|uniref:Uncharacterized protein n=1 Tax=Phytophthora infestans (strain T30-4) TaxID=403677 RepID=D0NPY2_PHYIT|nr:uncharacterized protein PITG_14477 [Phytophthora infestans T30-4]EEY62694.1 conserved hypothetical protein [Phytophthora infestans T30-4]|eukprot:XP_002898936.1 conserved hypothetical protein [Phytophthora infestans T30-4]
MCEHCVQQCTSRRHLSNHRRYCADNPNKVKSKKARLEADAPGGICHKCNRKFKKRNALYTEELAYVYHEDGVDDEVEHSDIIEEKSDDDFYVDNDDAVDAESDDESEDASEEEVEEEEGGEVGEAESAEESEWESEAESAQDSE